MSDQLLPSIAYDLPDAFQYEEQPGFTYKLHANGQQIGGYVDGLEAYKQAVYKILNTERYAHLIYSWNYGVELQDLIGKHIAYVMPEIERRVTEALMQDDRTESVDGFEFDTSKRKVVAVTFTVHSIYGEAKIQTMVAI